MKKIKVLFIVCAAATVFSALAFVNNVAAIAHWWSAFLAAGGDSASVAAKMPGFIPWLDWTAVDYSAVTTFIPFLGFLCMTVALARLVRGRRFRAGDFPFFRGSDQLNVALGLFGTLWGIIVIGYFKLDTVSMADLMQCLHTALFSTLMAVVWVFMFDRPLVRPYFTRLLELSGLAETDDGDLAAAVDRLVVRLGAASDAFEKMQTKFENAFKKRQEEFEAEFRKRQLEADDETEKRLLKCEQAFAKRISEVDEALSKRVDSSFEQLTQMQLKANDAVGLALTELERVRRDTADQCAKQLAVCQQTFEARQKEYAEFFKREIETLERRAAMSETKLRAVVSALQS